MISLYLIVLDPCDTATCFPNAQCFVQDAVPMCRCLPGFQLLPVRRACIDIDECKALPCGEGAICENSVGTFKCKCPSGTSGDPAIKCTGTTIKQCSSDANCRTGETCITGKCVCRRGFDLNPSTGKCEDINECLTTARPVCGVDAVCKNLPGSYECECPDGFSGNPFSRCDKCSENGVCSCQPPYKLIGDECRLAGCSSDSDCSSKAQCVKIAGGVSYCACPQGYRNRLADGSCEDIDECLDGLTSPCGREAICKNKLGSFTCTCPSGTSGDAYAGACLPVKLQCTSDGQCRENEKCSGGECVCLPPFFIDNRDGNRCRSPCDQFRCGLNAECTPTNPPQCLCKAGFTGNPLTGCGDVDECRDNPCGPNARCLNEEGSHKCQCPGGTKGEPYTLGCTQSGSKSECRSDSECPGQLSCQNGQCNNPCAALPCGEHATCIPENHAAWCRCNSGYKENSEGKCTSQCLGVRCGQNAQCIVSNQGPVCVCLEGMMGNPFPGGVCSPVVCSLRNPCAQRGQICDSGRCLDACQGKTCGLNARCDSETGQCICGQGFIGDPNLFCMPPVGPPVCSPGCGPNSHCEYGTPNKCVCDPGYSGNPYTGCQNTQYETCADLKCGSHATCSMATGVPQCICQKGYTGNAYDKCLDIDECAASICSDNAICINTPGSYDCRCRSGYIGNPFTQCTKEDDGRIDDLCISQKCGPNAVCNLGQCLCAPGFEGDDPYNVAVGCSAVSKCTYNTDCGYNEICTKVQNSNSRQCVDACSRASCGPNAFCVTDNHHRTCICNEGYSGDPNDVQVGCTKEVTCQSTTDCPSGQVCQISISGDRSCLNPCQIMSCPDGEQCKVLNERPVCECAPGHSKNKFTGVCEFVSIGLCSSDSECRLTESCQEGTFGTKQCTDVCSLVTCPKNAVCVADNHRGYCKCREGYAGNPDSRQGCSPVSSTACSNDAECNEDEVCRVMYAGLKACTPACKALKCGPGAICEARNHIGKCTCPPGLFRGDPYNGGCEPADCIENDDCPENKYCDRLSYKCLDVCRVGICGNGAVCTADDRLPKCICPPGYGPDPTPEIRCSLMKDNDVCLVKGQCQTACVSKKQCQSGETCKGGVCVAGCTGNEDCPGQDVCHRGNCRDPCSVGKACGPNSLCVAENKREVCNCPDGFAGVPTATQGCVRIPDRCSANQPCPPGHKCLKGSCMKGCSMRSDCARGEHCLDNGMCMKVCRSHKNCLQGEICVDKYCRPGCNTDNDCKPTESCGADGTCTCAKGYIKTPSGCQDIDECKGTNVCPATMRCENKPGSHTCKCPSGTVGDAIRGCAPPDECRNDLQCADHLACSTDPLTGRKKCQDPCDVAFCTNKATCKTIGHKPFCSCPPQHRGDPTDPNIGCYKVECESDQQCAGVQACDLRSYQCIGK